MTPKALQLKSFSLDAARPIIDAYATRPGGLLNALNAVQEVFGYVDKSLVAEFADSFNLSRAEVYGVISFYHDLRNAPPGRYVVKICQAEACQAVGSRELTTHAKEHLGMEFHETDAAARISFEPVYCLGNCATGPSVMINDQVYSRVDGARFDTLIKACRKGAAL